MKRLFLLFIPFALPISGAGAADNLNEFKYINKDATFSFLGGVGYTFIRADEIVYADGNRISHLLWQSQMPVLTGSFRGQPVDRMTVTGRMKFGFGGNHRMADYDWLQPYFKSYAFDDWTDRSIHDDTNLDRYINLDLAVGRDVEIDDHNVLNLHGGFKYTDIKWTATGGQYVYSEYGFRDTTGSFPAEKGITYEQSFPAAFLGAEWRSTVDRWSFSVLGRVGATFFAKDIDHHWKRDLLFTEEFESKPFLDSQIEVSYAVTECAGIYLSAAYEKYLRMKGDVLLEDISTGSSSYTRNGAGAGLQSFTLGGGLKVAF